MINRMCDTGRGICPHMPQCDHYCQFTAAELAPAPRTVNLDDIEPVPEVWQKIASFAVGFVLVALMVVFLMLFFTGLWVWSLLI
jgi:hypothetical protein